jgi:hypothetical protein
MQIIFKKIYIYNGHAHYKTNVSKQEKKKRTALYDVWNGTDATSEMTFEMSFYHICILG